MNEKKFQKKINLVSVHGMNFMPCYIHYNKLHCNPHVLLSTFGYFFIRVGSDESTRWGDRIYIKRIIIHPEYNDTSQENDIALIELNEELKFNRDWIQPIQLANESFKVLENLTVRAAAYGQTCDTRYMFR